MVLNGHDLITLLIATLGGGLGVKIVADLLKRTCKLESSAVIHTVVVALSVVASGAQYLIQLHGSLPPTVLGISATTIYGFSQLAHRYSGYGIEFLGKVRDYNASIRDTAGNQAAAAAITSETPTTANF